MNWQTTPNHSLTYSVMFQAASRPRGTLWEEASFLHNRSCNIIFIHSFMLSYRYESISLLAEGTLLIPGEGGKEEEGCIVRVRTIIPSPPYYYLII